jgi:hypothetical protein
MPSFHTIVFRMRALVGGMVILGFLVSADLSVATAQSADSALARSLFEEGVAFADRGEWQDAADRFRRSLEIRPSAVVAYNLGSALVELGELVAASEAFERAARAPSESGVRDAARSRLAEIRPRIGALTIAVEGTLTEDVELRIDERALPHQAVGVEVPVDPGRHVVDARRAGEVVASAETEVEAGGSESVTLAIPDPPPESEEEEHETGVQGALATSTEEDEGGGALSSPWLWLGVGLAVAAGVAVALTLVLWEPPAADPIYGTLQPGIVEF